MAAAHVFVDDLSAPALDDGDRHHLERVLRLRDGEAVTASDGRGGVVACRWVAGTLEVDGEVSRHERPAELTVAFAPVKGERPEWAVQKLTELGVDRIVALDCARSVVRWDAERAAKHLQRWSRIAQEAAMQARRVWLPEVEQSVSSPPALAARHAGTGGGGAGPGKAVMADLGGEPLDAEVNTVLVGPEGGWSPEERGLLPAASLTGTVLRTETAAVAAGVLLCAHRDRTALRGARSSPEF